MFEPRLRKVLLKRMLDATVYRGVAPGAAVVVVASERERDAVVECGVAAEKIRVRGTAFRHRPRARRAGISARSSGSQRVLR